MGYRLIFWYLFRQHLGFVVLVLLGLSMIVFLGQFAENSRYQIDFEHWTVGHSFLMALYQMPGLLQAVLQHALLISAALTVGRASKRLEVTILMQNGLSQRKILLPVALAGALVGAAYTLVVNPISGQTSNASDVLFETAARGAPNPDRREPREMILRDEAGANYLLIDHVSAATRTLYGVRVYRVDTDHSLRQSIEAPRAVAIDTDTWRLEEMRELYRAPDLIAATSLSSTLKISSRALTERFENESVVSFYELPAKIELARVVGAPDHELRLQYYWLLALPALLGGVSFLSGALVMRPLQRGGWKGDAVFVLGAAFCIYSLSTVLDAMGGRAVVSPVLAVGMIPLATIAAGAAVLWVRRTGSTSPFAWITRRRTALIPDAAHQG